MSFADFDFAGLWAGDEDGGGFCFDGADFDGEFALAVVAHDEGRGDGGGCGRGDGFRWGGVGFRVLGGYRGTGGVVCGERLAGGGGLSGEVGCGVAGGGAADDFSGEGDGGLAGWAWGEVSECAAALAGDGGVPWDARGVFRGCWFGRGIGFVRGEIGC